MNVCGGKSRPASAHRTLMIAFGGAFAAAAAMASLCGGCSSHPSDAETNKQMRQALNDPGVAMDKLPPERQKALRAIIANGNKPPESAK